MSAVLVAVLTSAERALRRSMKRRDFIRFIGGAVAVCLTVADRVNSANAQQTEVTKAEAALAPKIRCEDFKENVDGTWTSGPNAKIGGNAFANHTFETHGVSIGRADLATVLNRKCKGLTR
jgi:small-conductance mechanosensitive channel